LQYPFSWKGLHNSVLYRKLLLQLPVVGDTKGFLPSSSDFAFPYTFVLIRTTFIADVGVVVEGIGADSRLLLVTAAF